MDPFVAQEMINANGLVCRPMLVVGAIMRGYGSTQCAVGAPPQVAPQPVVPGR